MERCRALRQSSTDAEALLWRLLRNRQIAGAKFRRQHQFGSFILDFYCYEQKLVIELDGGQHTALEQAMRDAARTQYLQSDGLTVLRFTNREVLQETEAVVSRIWDVVEGGAPSA
ncbi:MAG: endonuclease domain-containing protein [Chloroflexi bacterium]|nr:endonuclease domain-containing protein [Chloroflexota bacterium]